MNEGHGGDTLAISTKISVNPTNAIHGIFILLKTMIIVIIRVKRDDLEALISLQQNLCENVSRVTRSDLPEGRQRRAGNGLKDLQSFGRNEVHEAFDHAANNLIAALDEFSDAGTSADGGRRGGGGGGGYDVT